MHNLSVLIAGLVAMQLSARIFMPRFLLRWRRTLPNHGGRYACCHCWMILD